MFPVHPAMEIYSVERTTETCLLGIWHFGSSCSSRSPKVTELLVRYETEHTTVQQELTNDLNHPGSDKNLRMNWLVEIHR